MLNMKAKINYKYEVKEIKTGVSEIDIVAKFTKYVNGANIESTYDLIAWLEDFLYDYDHTSLFDSTDLFNSTNLPLVLLYTNLDELVLHFSYLIKPQNSCCEGMSGNFCSKCGKQLNK